MAWLKTRRWLECFAALLLGSVTSLALAQPPALPTEPAGTPPPANQPIPAGTTQGTPAPARPAAPARPPESSRTPPRALLLQARVNLAQGNLESAEKLAREADKLAPPGTFAVKEDNPSKVLEEVTRARTDPKLLLQAAKSSFNRKEYDKAEHYAKLADKNSAIWTFPLWGDSPSSLLKEIQAARAVKPAARAEVKAPAGTQAGTIPPLGHPEKEPTRTIPPTSMQNNPAAMASANTQGSSPTDSSATSGAEAKARVLLKQARQALQGGNYSEASKLTGQARALKPGLNFWEDTPDKVDADINLAVAKDPAKTNTKAAAGEKADPVKPKTKEDAVALIQKGRRELTQSKFDEALKSAQKAKTTPNISWGLFEDSPDRLLLDIDKARVNRDQNESVKVLSEGRKLLEKGDFDGASRLAYKAQKLHGAYSIWDLGDRPARLLDDIQTARAQARRKGAEAKTALVKNTPENKTPSSPETLLQNTQLKPPPSPTPTSPANSRTEPAGSAPTTVAALPPGVVVDKAASGSGLPPLPPSFGEGSPPIPTPSSTSVASGAGSTPPAPTGDQSENKARAHQLVKEALSYQKQGQLLESRQKIVEARQLGATFSPEELSPDLVYQMVSLEVRQRVENLTLQAQTTASSGKDEAHYKMAEQQLLQARQLASTFGQDTGPIVQKLEWLKTQRTADRGDASPAIVQAPPMPATGPAPTGLPGSEVSQAGLNVPPGAVPGVVPASGSTAPVPVNQGVVLLDQGRVELRKGELGNARRLAEEAYKGNYGVQEDAVALLRSIDAEQFNQSRLNTQRSFDAAMSAYNRRDYAHSRNLMSGVDVRQLDPDRQVRLREIMMTPEMQPGRTATDATGVARATDQNAQPTSETNSAEIRQVAGREPAGASQEAPGRATAGDRSRAPEVGLLDQTKMMRQVVYDKARQEGLEVQREAAEKFRTGQMTEAIDMLTSYLARLDETQLDSRQLGTLKRPVESRLNHFKLMKSQKELADGVRERRDVGNNQVAATRRAEELKRQNLEKLMKDFNVLYKEGKYSEAESVAMKAHELDPDSGVATAGMVLARRQRDVRQFQDIKDRRERQVKDQLDDAEDEGDPAVIHDKLVFDKARWETVKNRKPLSPITISKKHPSEKDIERKLQTPVNLSFKDAPLATVISELRDVHAVNIVEDYQALQEDGISLDSPVTIKLQDVSLKSALNLILNQVRLTYVIKDEVLQITTQAHATGKLETKTFQVADLVIPIDNFGDVKNPMASPLTAINNNQPTQSVPTPVTGPMTLPSGTPTGSAMGAPASGSPFASNQGASGPVSVSKKSANNTMEEMLIKLITSSVQPRTWADMGGPGTVEYFPLTMALVINQTPDIQEQISDLLAALRRLQDQEVAVEVRFITIQENFFERIGVNFNLNILTDNQNARFEPQLTSGNFAPAGFINAFDPGRFLAGLTPAGTLTSNLDIPITTQTFAQAIPPFGGYPGVPGYGGLTLGLAFLSDIQVFLFMEAVQGDTRTNVMQAPKLSLFNGQTSTLNVNDLQFFVTGVTVQTNMGQFLYQPQVQQFPLGVQLTIQAVISADRRFVRMSLSPQLTNLASPQITLFPVVTPIFPQFDGTATGQPIVFTQFIQQPVITSVSVQTTVAVPDGGTVLLGGLKRLSEGRNEFGPPILSKIPYINRLFKNVGYGRETDSLLMMVTPRIIIQEEEEERSTGFRSAAAVAP